MNYFADNTIEEIRSRLDIVDIISEKVPLKRAGGDFKACCPFHNEHTPSFIVSPSRRTFHCFGCGAHGDIFKFLMLTEGLNFPEAVKRLADKANVTISTTINYEAQAHRKMVTILGDLSRYYRNELLTSPSATQARQYLETRILPQEIIETFQIGYAPDTQKTIMNWGKERGYTPEDLVNVGILSPPQEGRKDDDYYDRFHGRLMFPIRNQQGEVVGFSGRILTQDKTKAKYVNTPETPVFHKGNILYALDIAKSKIVKSKRREAIVCEGQIDVIRLHSTGFGTAIASQGTAFTEDHVRLLKHYADSALLLFDADTAGQKATIRTGRLFLEQGLPVRVATLPEGEDPDSFLRDKGPTPFQEILDQAESLIAFQIRTMQNTEGNTIDAKMRITQSIIETLSTCKVATLRSFLLQEAATLLNIPTSAFENDLSEAISKTPTKHTIRPTHIPKQTITTQDNIYTSIAEILVHTEDSNLITFVRDWLPETIIEPSPEKSIILATIVDFGQDPTQIPAISAQNDDTSRLLSRLLSREDKFCDTEITPLIAIQDLVSRAWAKYLETYRQALPLSDPRRFTLLQTIKHLNTLPDWTTREPLIRQEWQNL